MKSWVRRTACAACFLVSAMVAGGGASDAFAGLFYYDLFNHPGGAAAPPQYGLRLDNLYNPTPGHDIFSFDFESNGAGMKLIYDDGGTAGNTARGDDKVRIRGLVYGGLDTGGSYGNANYRGLWEVDFTYGYEIDRVGTNGDNLKIGRENPLNQGTIKPLFDVGGAGIANDAILLQDEDGGFDYSFRFDRSGHGLAGTPLAGQPGLLTGWGWLNHHGGPHEYSSDWLFVGREAANPVPEPETVALMAMGLLGLSFGFLRRNG